MSSCGCPLAAQDPDDGLRAEAARKVLEAELAAGARRVEADHAVQECFCFIVGAGIALARRIEAGCDRVVRVRSRIATARSVIERFECTIHAYTHEGAVAADLDVNVGRP